MKINVLKNQIKQVSIKSALIVVGVGLLFGGVYYYKTTIDEEIEKLNSEKMSIQGMISQKEKLYEDAKKDYQLYKLLDKSKNPTPTGLAAANERISAAIPIFNDLKRNYRFTKLDFTISATTPSTKIQSSIFEVFESSLVIDYIGISDEFIFSFLNDVKYAIPGFAELSTLTVSKTHDLLGKNSANTDMVTGKVEMVWRSLKEKNVTQQTGSGVFKPDGTEAVFTPLVGGQGSAPHSAGPASVNTGAHP